MVINNLHGNLWLLRSINKSGLECSLLQIIHIFILVSIQFLRKLTRTSIPPHLLPRRLATTGCQVKASSPLSRLTLRVLLSVVSSPVSQSVSQSGHRHSRCHVLQSQVFLLMQVFSTVRQTCPRLTTSCWSKLSYTIQTKLKAPKAWSHP